jgi:S1-C subfamily serine protease
VIVDAGGLVITNNHVVEGATEVKVSLSDKREFEAEIVLKDARTDLAVLRVKEPPRERFAAIDFGNSDELQVGDVVLAIGNPFGVGQTVTHGIVSALARTQVGITDYQFFIQTDAAINPGNSGGPLVDMTGRIVGINTAIFSRSGGSHGIGFAIPSNLVKLVVDSAVSGKTLERPWLGAKLDAVTRDLAERLKLERVAGAVIVRLYDKGPAAEAGLQAGDGGGPGGRRRDRGGRRLRGGRRARRAVPADDARRRQQGPRACDPQPQAPAVRDGAAAGAQAGPR